MKIRSYYLFIVLILIFATCKGKKKKKKEEETNIVSGPVLYGEDYNPERIKKGITTVPKSYEPSIMYGLEYRKNIDEGIKWINKTSFSLPNHEFIVSYHDHKYIQYKYDTREPLSETDYFYNRNSFEHVTAARYDKENEKYIPIRTEKERIRLETIYIYNPGYFICVLTDSDEPKEITLAQADSVLLSWGINRMFPDRK
jgi:hypothetical protein